MSQPSKKYFSITPNSVQFSNYKTNGKYSRKITITNLAKKALQLCINFTETAEIKVLVTGNRKLPPGLSIIIEVIFRPSRAFESHESDRRHEIRISRSKSQAEHLIPVILLSPFPKISLPKEIALPPTAVGSSTFGTFFVANMGASSEEFAVSCSENLKVKPMRKTFRLKPLEGETFVLEGKFKGPGKAREAVRIRFERKNAVMDVLVSCEVEIPKIHFLEQTLHFPDTIAGKNTLMSTILRNDSLSRVSFEFAAPAAYPEAYGSYLYYHYDRINDILYEGVISRQVHTNILDRQLAEYSCAVQDMRVPFQSPCFRIFPMRGEVAPQSGTTINVSFEPPVEFENRFVETRAPLLGLEHAFLTLKGAILGPEICFVPSRVDFGKMTAGQTKAIRVKCRNKGFTDTIVAFRAFEAHFGGEIRINPTQVAVNPHSEAVLCIAYCNKNVGKFMENVIFDDYLRLTLTGEVRQSEVRVEPSTINFHDVAICCSYERKISIENETDFPVKVLIKAPQFNHSELLAFDEFFFESSSASRVKNYRDILEPYNEIFTSSLPCVSDVGSCDDVRGFAADEPESSRVVESVLIPIIENITRTVELIDQLIWNVTKKSSAIAKSPHFIPFSGKKWTLLEDATEYKCDPDELLLLAKERQDVSVKVIPNWPGVFRNFLELQVGESRFPVHIPLRHSCVVPQLSVFPQILEVFSVIGETTSVELKIRNDESTLGFVEFFDVVSTEVRIWTTPRKEVIYGGETKSFEMHVKPLEAGVLEHSVSLKPLGSYKFYEVLVTCKASVPVIAVNPASLDTTVQVLEQTSSVVEVLNPNPVSVKIRLKVLSEFPESVWLESSKALVGARSTACVSVFSCFPTSGTFRFKLRVETEHDFRQEIKFTHHVVGIPLKVTPDVTHVTFPPLVLGEKWPSFGFTIQNMSSSPYSVELRFNENRLKVDDPIRLICAKSETKFDVKAAYRFPGKLNELLAVMATRVRRKNCELLREIRFQAEIIRPALTFSEKKLSWKWKYGDRIDDLGARTVVVENVSKVPIPVNCFVDNELFYCEDAPLTFSLKPQETRELTINIVSAVFLETKASTVFQGTLKACFNAESLGVVCLEACLELPEVTVERDSYSVYKSLLPCFFTFCLTNLSNVDAEYSWEVSNFEYTSTASDVDKGSPKENFLKLPRFERCDFVRNLLDQVERESEKDFSLEDPEPLTPLNETIKKKSRRTRALGGGSDARSDITAASKKGGKAGKKRMAEAVTGKERGEEAIHVEEVELPEEEIKSAYEAVERIFESAEESFEDVGSGGREVRPGFSSNYFTLDFVRGILSRSARQFVSIRFEENDEESCYEFDLILSVKGGRPSRVHFKVKNGKYGHSFNCVGCYTDERFTNLGRWKKIQNELKSASEIR